MSIVETSDRTALPPSIRVRLAGPRDCEALTALLDNPAHAREQVLAWLETPGTTLLVAERGSDVIGLAVLLTRAASSFAGGVPRKVVELDNLVVRADQRGGRVGRRLLSAAVDWSRQRGATHVEVAVHAFNRDARRFYVAISVDRLVLAA